MAMGGLSSKNENTSSASNGRRIVAFNRSSGTMSWYFCSNFPFWYSSSHPPFPLPYLQWPTSSRIPALVSIPRELKYRALQNLPFPSLYSPHLTFLPYHVPTSPKATHQSERLLLQETKNPDSTRSSERIIAWLMSCMDTRLLAWTTRQAAESKGEWDHAQCGKCEVSNTEVLWVNTRHSNGAFTTTAPPPQLFSTPSGKPSSGKSYRTLTSSSHAPEPWQLHTRGSVRTCSA